MGNAELMRILHRLRSFAPAVAVLATLCAFSSPAGAEGGDGSHPSIIEVALEFGVIEVSEVDPPRVVKVIESGSAADRPPFGVLSASSIVFALADVDVDGNGFQAEELFQPVAGSAPPLSMDLPRGEPFTFRILDDPDATLILPQTDDFWGSATEFRWTTLELTHDLTTFDGTAEATLWYQIAGMPTIAPVEGANLPGVGLGFATGLVSENGVLSSVYVATDAASARPVPYGGAHVVASWQTEGRHFVGFGTERTDVSFLATAAHSPVPGDPSSFVFAETDLLTLPLTRVEMGPAVVDTVAFASAEAKAAAGAGAAAAPAEGDDPVVSDDTGGTDGQADSDDTGGTDDVVASDDAAETDAPIVADEEVRIEEPAPPGESSSGGGTPWVLIGGGALVAGGIWAGVRRWFRGEGDPEPLAVDGEEPGPVEAVTPVFGEAREAPIDPEGSEWADQQFRQLELAREGFDPVLLADALADLERPVVAGQIEIREKANAFRLGYLGLAADLSRSDVLDESRAESVELAQTGDVVVSLAQLGLMAVRGGQKVATLMTGETDDLVGAAGVTDDVVDTVRVTDDAPSGAVDEFGNPIPGAVDSDAALGVHDDYVGWDPRFAEEFDLENLTDADKVWIADAMKIELHRWADPMELQRLADRAGVDLSSYAGAVDYRGRPLSPIYIAKDLLDKIKVAEGWVHPGEPITRPLQTLAARLTAALHAGDGKGLIRTPAAAEAVVLQADELAVLNRIARDPEFASSLDRIPFGVNLKGYDLEVEPMFMPGQADTIRSLANALFHPTGGMQAIGATKPVRFALETAGTLVEVQLAPAIAELAAITDDVALRAALLAMREDGHAAIVIHGTFPADRLEAIVEMLGITPVPLLDGTGTLLARSVGSSGPPAWLLDQVRQLGAAPEVPVMFQTRMAPSVRVQLAQQSGVALGPLTADQVALIRRTLAGAVVTVSGEGSIDDGDLWELRQLVDAHPELVEQIPDIVVTDANGIGHKPFSTETAFWLDAIVQAGDRPDDLVEILGPIRLARVNNVRVSFADHVELCTTLAIGIEDRVRGVLGDWDRPFQLPLGFEIGGTAGGTLNIGFGLVIAPIETTVRFAYAESMSEELFTVLGAHTESMDDMRQNVHDIIATAKGMEQSLPASVIEDLQRDVAEIESLASLYEDLLTDAPPDWRDQHGAQIQETINELRAISGPATDLVVRLAALDAALPGLVSDLEARVVDPNTGDPRHLAPLEAPTLVVLGSLVETMRSELGGIPVPGAPGLFPSQTPVIGEERGEVIDFGAGSIGPAGQVESATIDLVDPPEEGEAMMSGAIDRTMPS